MVSSTSRFPFLAAVALLAAASTDPLVETISNTGVFGRGYADDNHLSVIPALAAGSVIALAFVLVRCIALFGRASTLGIGAWISGSASDFARGTSLRDVPIVVVMQFSALFAMENAEQLATGRLLGGSAWLGGPVAFGVLAHIVAGAAFTLILGAFARSILAFVASLVRETIEAILSSLSRGAARRAFSMRYRAWLPRAQAPHVRQIGGRAPPLPSFA